MSLFNKTPGSPSIPAPLAHQQAAPSPVQPAAPSGLAPLTEEDVKKALPSTLRSAVTQSLVDTLNGISSDPIVAQNIRENFVGYTAILKEGKFKIDDYLNAVAYVSFKLMNYSNQDAYARAFPQRYAALVAKGCDSKTIAAYVSAYHKGKLVNLIMEQSLVPTWVLNQDVHQKAINRLAHLMDHAVSEKVQVEAAVGLLSALKKPEAVKGQLDLNINESAGMREMKEALAQLAQRQQEAIERGEMRTIEVAGSKLINKAEAEDV